MGVSTYCLRQDILRVIIKGNNEEIYFYGINFKFQHNENDIVSNGIGKYLNIPQNKVAFYDFYIKNVKLNYDGVEKITNFAQYKEELIEDELFFNAYFVDIGGLKGTMVILSMMQRSKI
jgi:hypothetical protein